MARKSQAPRNKKDDENVVRDALESKTEQKELAAAWERGYSQKGADDGRAWRKNVLERANVEPPRAARTAKDDSHAFEADGRDRSVDGKDRPRSRAKP